MRRLVLTASAILVVATLFLPTGVVAQSASPQAAQPSGSIGVLFQTDNQAPERVSKLVVKSVIENGPADKAGLKPGDTIGSVDGKRIENVAELVNAIKARPIGSTVIIGYLRQGKQFEATIIIVERAKLYRDWMQKRAGQGDAEAQNELGFGFVVGDFGLPKDDAQAAYWYRKAAEQGNAFAQNYLGWMCANGKGVPQDSAQALSWYRKAAEQGNSNAETNLGLMYALGKGVPRDDGEAVQWWRKAADQGHALAEANLGWKYASGQGVRRDYAQAVSWFRKAAEQGEANGQSGLGWAYEYGSGVPKDSAQAVYWYEKAVAQGNESAKAGLARLGRAVPNTAVAARASVPAPTISVLEPGGIEPGTTIDTSSAQLHLRGIASHGSGITAVSVNGQGAYLKTLAPQTVEFDLQNVPVSPGASAVVVVATAGDKAQGQLLFTVNRAEVRILDPAPNFETSEGSVKVRGVAAGFQNVEKVEVAGVGATLRQRQTGEFEFEADHVPLSLGNNTLSGLLVAQNGLRKNFQLDVKRLPPPGPPPLTFNEVQKALQDGVTANRMSTLVAKFGVDFSLTDETEKALRSEGADSNLLITIAKSRK